MKKISFEESLHMWAEYVSQKLYNQYTYPSLGKPTIMRYPEWCKPDMYYIDGVNQKELSIRWMGEDYLASDIETIEEWLKRI